MQTIQPKRSKFKKSKILYDLNHFINSLNNFFILKKFKLINKAHKNEKINKNFSKK